MNPYKAVAQLLSKEKNLIIQHERSDYLICNNTFMAKVPEKVYQDYFRPVSGRLIDVPTGSIMETRNKGEIPYNKSAFNLYTVIPKNTTPVLPSQMLHEHLSFRGKVNYVGRIFYDDRGAVAEINDKIYQALRDFNGAWGATGSRGVMEFTDGILECYIMPLIPEFDAYKIFKGEKTNE